MNEGLDGQAGRGGRATEQIFQTFERHDLGSLEQKFMNKGWVARKTVNIFRYELKGDGRARISEQKTERITH